MTPIIDISVAVLIDKMGGKFCSRTKSNSDVALSEAVCRCYGEDTTCITVLREDQEGIDKTLAAKFGFLQSVALQLELFPTQYQSNSHL